MPYSDPLSAVDGLVADAIRGHADVLAIIGSAERVDAIDRRVDLREQFENAPDLGPRIWIRPDDDEALSEYSNGACLLVQNYRVMFAAPGRSLGDARSLRWALLKALVRLSRGKAADGGALNLSALMPLELLSISVGGTRPEREPLDAPAEWQDEIVVQARLMCSYDAIGA